MNRSKYGDTIRLLGGGYLVYLGIKIVREGVLTGSMQGKERVFAIICCIFFVVFGAGLAVYSIRNLFAATKDDRIEEMYEQADVEAEEAADAEAEEAEEVAEETAEAEAGQAEADAEEAPDDATDEENAKDNPE